MTYEAPYSSVEMIGNVYVYLFEDDKPVCYWTGPATKFTNPNPSYEWIILNADKVVNVVKEDYMAGMV